MDQSGKVIWAKHSEIQQVNLKSFTGMIDGCHVFCVDSKPTQPTKPTNQLLDVVGEATDGERLVLPTKDLGTCEVFPQMLKHNSNGRFVVVCGEGEYIIYTSLAWRNKSFGTGLEFVWGNDTGEYAVRESTSKIKFFRDFKEVKSIRPNFSAEGIHGGVLLAARSPQFVVFYDWEEGRVIRKIDVAPKAVWMSISLHLSVCVY
jgi:coatomer subunit beta'